MDHTLKTLGLKKPVAITLTTDQQAYKVLLTLTDLDPNSTAAAIRAVAKAGDPLKAVNLLGRKELWEKLVPTVAVKLKAALSAHIAHNKRMPDSQLVIALEANPKGNHRRDLLNLICEKASSADKALFSRAKLSVSEKVRLAFKALETSSYDYKAKRARFILSLQLNYPQLRETCIQWVAKDTSGYQASEVLARTESYFPEHKPMTLDERTKLVKVLYIYPISSAIEYWNKTKRDNVPILTLEERAMLANAAVTLACDGHYHHSVRQLLEHPEVLALVEPHLVNKLKAMASKAA